MEHSNKKIRINIITATLNNNLIKVKQALIINPKCINNQNIQGYTSLNIAVIKGFLDIVKFLLICDGINVNLGCIGQSSPLRNALFQTFCNNEDILPNSHHLIVKELIKHPCLTFNTAAEFSSLCWCDSKSFELLYGCPKFDINSGILKFLFCSQCQQVEKIKSLLSNGANCTGWQNWKFSYTTLAKNQLITTQILSKWRSYLPKWSIFNHKKFYPKEFEDLTITCMIVWNRLETMHSLRICKDIKCLLIKYVANNWRKKVDEY